MKIILLFALLLSIAGDVLAMEPDALTRADHMSNEVMSPYCPGRTLAACPSENARVLRADIASWFDEGYNENAVRQRLQMIYGETVFGVPKDSAVGLLGWYAPAAFFCAGILLITFVLRRRMNNTAENDNKSDVAISSEKREEIESELKKRLEQR